MPVPSHYIVAQPPFDRPPYPADIFAGRAGARYLCSAIADYVTGAVLPVDGGTSAGGGWVRGGDGAWTRNEGLRFGALHPRK